MINYKNFRYKENIMTEKKYSDEEIIQNIMKFKALHEFELRQENKLRHLQARKADDACIQQVKKIIEKTRNALNDL